MTPRGSKNQSILLRIAPTNSHCGQSATVIVTVSNPRTRATIESAMFHVVIIAIAISRLLNWCCS